MSGDALSGPVYRGRRRGMMFVLSSPSGAGKTSLSRRLLAQNPDLVLSISATTREPRPGETDGGDYFFMDEDAFMEKAFSGAFYEWAKVFGRCYGTPREPVEAALADGRDVVFDIDWQGARKLAEAAPEDVVRVFILPPSLEVLKQRLTNRGQDDEGVIAERMSRAKAEIEHWDEYDYVVVNEDFARALEDITRILHAERLKRDRHPWLAGFVDALMGEG